MGTAGTVAQSGVYQVSNGEVNHADDVANYRPGQRNRTHGAHHTTTTADPAMMRLGALLEVAIRPVILRRAAMTSLVVGSLLTFVNHGSVILDRGLAPELVWPILLTYLTPYAVATISSASMVGVGNPTEIERDRP